MLQQVPRELGRTKSARNSLSRCDPVTPSRGFKHRPSLEPAPEAFYLRAKTRMSRQGICATRRRVPSSMILSGTRQRIEPARSDLAAAAALRRSLLSESSCANDGADLSIACTARFLQISRPAEATAKLLRQARKEVSQSFLRVEMLSCLALP